MKYSRFLLSVSAFAILGTMPAAAQGSPPWTKVPNLDGNTIKDLPSGYPQITHGNRVESDVTLCGTWTILRNPVTVTPITESVVQSTEVGTDIFDIIPVNAPNYLLFKPYLKPEFKCQFDSHHHYLDPYNVFFFAQGDDSCITKELKLDFGDSTTRTIYATYAADDDYYECLIPHPGVYSDGCAIKAKILGGVELDKALGFGLAQELMTWILSQFNVTLDITPEAKLKADGKLVWNSDYVVAPAGKPGIEWHDSMDLDASGTNKTYTNGANPTMIVFAEDVWTYSGSFEASLSYSATLDGFGFPSQVDGTQFPQFADLPQWLQDLLTPDSPKMIKLEAKGFAGIGATTLGKVILSDWCEWRCGEEDEEEPGE